MPNEREVCEKVCRVASDLGYQIDDLGNSISGQSFTFVAPDGERVMGGICKTREQALFNACAKLMPHIATHL